MRLLQLKPNGEFGFTKDLITKDVPAYAILSHTWLDDDQEPTLRDLTEGDGNTKVGYRKIQFCAKQAARDGLHYFWVDTCCIDKSNNTELSEAINSMFRWYRNAAKCYVYLSDVSINDHNQSNLSLQSWEAAFRKSRWFTRGWTLQELIAPLSVEFFSLEGKRLGDKQTLERQVCGVTGLPVAALEGNALCEFSVAERMSWAEKRETKREEDKAYSLLGIFDVHIPLIYGEGMKNAFRRLEEEIDKRSSIDRSTSIPNETSIQGDNWLTDLPYAVEAPFNSYQRQHEPTCLENTRVEILDKIHAWADKQDKRCLFWLNGLAGTGKSTIARTVARRYFEKKRLGASFFFTRGGGEIGHAGTFVTTVAVQLAESVPSLRRHVRDAITERSDITNQSLRDQWHQLVLRPLSKLDGKSSHSSYVLVIDALDECDDNNNIRTILQLLAEAGSMQRVQLRVFLTSRPEIPIRYGFNQIPGEEREDFILHSISPSIVDKDITIFLEHNLTVIGQEDEQEPGWPGFEAIRGLVETASGLFIWAATACRFIREGLSAEERLHMLLEGGNAHSTPEEHLNRIYVTVLRSSIQTSYTEQERHRFCDMLREFLGSIVILFSSLSVISLSRLHHTTKQHVDRTLKNVHAILDIPKDQTRPLRLHHPSFRDFLVSTDRCRDPNFQVNEKQAHQELATRCIQLMSKSLKQNICGLESPYTLIADIDSSQVKRSFPPELQYACLYWIQHFHKSSAQLRDDDQVHQFLREHLLHWFEALGWMQKISEGIHAITSLESFVTLFDCPRLSEFVHDTKRFIMFNRQAIEQAPFQTYCSALVFAPAMSIVRKQFNDCVPQWMRRPPKVEKGWNALLQTLEGHSGGVAAVAFSPDGKLLASASYDKTVRLWDTGSGAALQTLEGHSLGVTAVAFSPDGKLLASASRDETVRLWDTGSGAALQTLEGHSGVVAAVAFSPDGKLLASASHDRTVKLWDTSSGAALQTLEGHSRGVTAVAFSPDGKLLASASGDKTIRLWDISSGAALQTLEGHSRGVIAVAFSPNGKLLASASGDETIRLWDISSGAALQTLEGHSEGVIAVAFSPDGKLLASASGDKTIRLWDISSGAALQTLEDHSRGVTAVAFSPDGKLLASASDDETVRLRDTSLGAALQTLEGHSDVVTAVAFSPDGKLLASASDDETVRLWDTGSGAALQTLEGHSLEVTAVAFSPDGKLLASASRDKTVRLWDTSSGAALQTLEGHSRGVTAVAFSPDGELLASASRDETVRLWDTGSGAALQTLKGHSLGVTAVAFSPDDRLLASASYDKTVRLWDTGSGAALQTLEGHSGVVTAVAFSPNGELLASASHDETVKLWDTGSGAALQTLEGHSGGVTAVAFSPDGELLASASRDETVRLWDASSGAALQTFEVDAVVQTISFSGDGTCVQTNRGPLYTTYLSDGAIISRPNPSRSVFVKDKWVGLDMDNLLWLPSDHRQACVAIYGNTVSFGLTSGRVSLMEFAS